jgi:hypothetical protein
MDCIPKKSKERMAVLEHKGQFNFWLDKCNQILSDMSKYIFGTISDSQGGYCEACIITENIYAETVGIQQRDLLCNKQILPYRNCRTVRTGSISLASLQEHLVQFPQMMIRQSWCICDRFQLTTSTRSSTGR